MNKVMLLILSVIFSVVTFSSLVHGQDRVVVVPLLKNCGKAQIPIDEIKEFIAPGYSVMEEGQEFANLRTKCLDTQATRYEVCAEDYQGEADQAACEAKITEWQKLCYKLPEEETVTETELGIIFCTNTVFAPIPVQKCTVAKPCNLGPPDRNGDGLPDICVTGQRCNPANEGAICDPGILWNCNLTTKFYPAGIIRPLDECKCLCI